jgi:hypothetical protein
MATPWNTYIDTTPSSVFYRDNLQEYVTKPWQNLKVIVADPPPPPICFEGTHTITGTGTLTGQTNPAVNSTYTYYGGGSLDGNYLNFYVDNQTVNVLGTTHMLFSVSFDYTTGDGIQEVLSCTGSALMCAEVNPLIGTPDAISDYPVSNVDYSDLDNITWDVNMVLEIPGLGLADSESSLAATLGDPQLPENCRNGVDDDCDGYLDCDDSDCSSDYRCGYHGVANAEAASHGSSSLTGSGTFNALTLLLVPIGAVILLRVLRRKK